MSSQRVLRVERQAKETMSVENLRQTSEGLYDSSEWLRVSSALYLFKEDHWTVFHSPKGFGINA